MRAKRIAAALLAAGMILAALVPAMRVQAEEDAAGTAIEAAIKAMSAAKEAAAKAMLNGSAEKGSKDFEIREGVLVSYSGKDTRVVIPEGVEEIGENAFSNQSQLEELYFPEGVEVVGQNAFYRCISLRSIKLPESLKRIESYAFLSCTSLEEITLPGGITKIGDSAFAGCRRLADVHFSEGATGLMGKDMFYWTQWLIDTLAEQPDETPFVIVNGTVIAVRKEDMGEGIVLPEGVTAISGRAFAGTQLVSITLPESLKEIGEEAFRDCLDLEQVLWSASPEKIDSRAFYNCPKVKQIGLPEEITKYQ